MSEKVFIQNIADLLAEDKGISRQEAEAFIKAMFDLTKEALGSDQYIKVKGLGTFKLIKVNSRESININTGDRFIIPGHTKVSFTPDSTLRDLINKPFAHFETVVLNDDTVLEDTVTDEEGEDENTDPEEETYNSNMDLKNREPQTEQLSTPGSTIREKTVSGTLPINKDVEEKALIVADSFNKNNPPEISRPVKDNIKSPDMNQEEKQALPYFIAVIAIIIVMLSGTIIYIYKPGLLLSMLPESKNKTEMGADTLGGTNSKEFIRAVAVTPKDTISDKDTLPVADKQKELPFEKILKEVRKERIEKKTAKLEPVHADSMNYQIAGTKTTYTLKPGETLIMVSKRFYGTKDLWPYIAKHNCDIIKDPDKVPFGTTIKVPELKIK